MSPLPSLTGKEITAALLTIGFVIVRVRGSHHILRHPDGRMTVIPIHAGESIGPGLLSRILADCELTREEFAELL